MTGVKRKSGEASGRSSVQKLTVLWRAGPREDGAVQDVCLLQVSRTAMLISFIFSFYPWSKFKSRLRENIQLKHKDIKSLSQ